MSMYSEIKSYAKAMLEESTLTKRREAGRRLEQKLASARVRQVLGEEAGNNRKQALSEMWRFIVQNSVHAVEKIARSRSKLNQADILVCFSVRK